jgi:hypothetical protein
VKDAETELLKLAALDADDLAVISSVRDQAPARRPGRTRQGLGSDAPLRRQPVADHPSAPRRADGEEYLT